MSQLLQKISNRFNKLINEKRLLDDEDQFEVDLELPITQSGLNAQWNALFMYYKRKSRLIPIISFNIKASVRHSNLIIETWPFTIRIPLISINYIESDEELEKLDIRGRSFKLTMWKVNAESIEDLREWLRFLVVRQRIPHSIMGLPFDWEVQHKNSKSVPKIKFKRLI